MPRRTGEWFKTPRPKDKQAHEVIASDPFKVMIAKKSRKTSVNTILRQARFMYALPQEKKSDTVPVGYSEDTVVGEDGLEYFQPRDDIFLLLVKGREYLKYASYQKVADWLDREFKKLEYNPNKNKKKPVTDKGDTLFIIPSTLQFLYTNRPPLNECLLTLDERKRVFAVEVESLLSGKGDTGKQHAKKRTKGSVARSSKKRQKRTTQGNRSGEGTT